MSSSLSNSNNSDITSATNTLSAGTLQAGVIQAAATQVTTVGTTDVIDSKALSATSSGSASVTTSATSVVISTQSVATSARTTSSSSSSSTTSAKVTSVLTTSASQATTTSLSSSASVSLSKASSTASSSDSTSSVAQTTQAPSPSATTSAGFTAVQAVSTGTVDGHLTTLTTQVFEATSSSSAQPTPTALGAESFFENKAAVGGVFGAAGLVFLIVFLAVVLKIVRYRSRKQFEKDLDEQVQHEVRSGTPMFGLGKDDDGLSIMGGRAGGIGDPEKAMYANSGNGYTNTAVYPTYSGSVPPMAAQPAYYSPNTFNGVPRRSPSQDQSLYYGDSGLSRTNSHGSTRSYGSLNQPPMNAFASPTSNAATNAPIFAPVTFAANYGEYRHASTAPSTRSWQSQNQNQAVSGARPGTPLALTPGSRGNSIPSPPRNVLAPLGTRSDSPAVLARYSLSSSRNSKDGYGANAYIAGQITQIQTQSMGGLGAPAHGKEPPSPNVPLPNPFDQRDQ
ncbi:hypothetical protein F5890DRAFT_1062337 [Lentinula detonsa]|uniref:Uncharacterized protein n=1 Tax=Lentinula detonsa TaxID=2804962 RepID=A0AA38Q354_9AGAR|nr:hypothetical protein F5890DRAFT_1062337 [Lentinula detonsa]